MATSGVWEKDNFVLCIWFKHICDATGMCTRLLPLIFQHCMFVCNWHRIHMTKSKCCQQKKYLQWKKYHTHHIKIMFHWKQVYLQKENNLKYTFSTVPWSWDQVPLNVSYRKLFNLLVDQWKHKMAHQLQVTFFYNHVWLFWNPVLK